MNVASEHSSKIHKLQKSYPLRFTGRIYDELDLVAKCCLTSGFLQRGHGRLEGIVTALDIGVIPLEEQPVEQIAIVRLTPTYLALPEIRNGHMVQSWTGEIRPFSDSAQQESMLFDTPFGMATFSQHYCYEQAYIDDVRVTVQIPVPTLTIKEVNQDYRTKDIPSLMKTIKEYLVHIESIVSFLSRRRVKWSEIEIISKDSKKHKHARHLRTVSGSAETQRELICPASLGTHELDSILQTFIESPY